MNESHAFPTKSYVSERELRLINYEDQDQFLELRRILGDEPKKSGVELFLEVEIEESLRQLLQSRKDCGDLLDVTVIQQAKSLHETTVSLGFDEVSEFIEMVNQHNAKDKKNLIQQQQQQQETKTTRLDNNIFPKQKTSKKNHYFDCITGEEIPQYHRINHQVEYATAETVVDSDDYSAPKPLLIPDKTTVYTTPYTFDRLKKNLPCLASQDEDEDDKPGTPCLCQHCGMVGVLVESQKRPAIPHTPNPKSVPLAPLKPHQSLKKRIIDLRSKSKSETNLILLKELSNKITSLEDRLNEQEEKTVRKDYFKFVIHKLLTQYSNKLNELRNETVRPGINIATQYSKTRPFSQDYGRKKSWDRNHEKNKIYHCNIDQESSEESESTFATKSHKRGRSKTKDDPKKTRGRLANIIEDKLRRKTEKHNSEKHNDILKLPSNTDDMGGKYTKSIFTANRIEQNPFHIQKSAPEAKRELMKALEKEIEENMSSQTIKQLCDLVYNKNDKNAVKNFNVKNDDSTFKKNIQAQKQNVTSWKRKDYRYGDIPEKLLNTKRNVSVERMRKNDVEIKRKDYRHSEIPERMLNTKRNVSVERMRKNDVNISYINPAAKAWYEGQSSDADLIRKTAKKSNKHTIEEKIKYLKNLARRKNVDEAELWNNILSQAKRHIKSNEDTVSIQLPGGLKNREMSELELTLSNLKEIVKRSRSVKRNKSCLSVELNYKTSSDNYIKKRTDKRQNKIK